MLGGSLGALCRYLLGLGVHRWLKPEYLPTGTMVVNLLGCFLIGLLAALFELKNWGSGWPRIFLFVGFSPLSLPTHWILFYCLNPINLWVHF